MVAVGDWQMQIIFRQNNQYRARIFVYAGDNIDRNGGRYPILGAWFGLKPKIWLSYFLEMKNYTYLVTSWLVTYHINEN